MASKDPAVRSAASRLAVTQRWHPEQDPGELQRDLRAAQLEEHVRRVVAAAPPLTDEQRSRLSTLLSPPGASPTRDPRRTTTAVTPETTLLRDGAA